MKKNYIAPEVLIVDLNTEDGMMVTISNGGEGDLTDIQSNRYEGVDIWGENE